MIAEKTITLYNPDLLEVVAEVYEGQQYEIPSNILVYEGTKKAFLKANKNYKDNEDNRS